jgi:hypothetical protein
MKPYTELWVKMRSFNLGETRRSIFCPVLDVKYPAAMRQIEIMTVAGFK